MASSTRRPPQTCSGSCACDVFDCDSAVCADADGEYKLLEAIYLRDDDEPASKTVHETVDVPLRPTNDANKFEVAGTCSQTLATPVPRACRPVSL